MTSKINLYCEDCLPAMRKMADNQYDLAIIDPVYGIGEDGVKNHSRGKLAKPTLYKPKNWDKKPTEEYFNELFRISNYCIIWGMNNFDLPQTEYFIVWDKHSVVKNFSRCELAWTNVK